MLHRYKPKPHVPSAPGDIVLLKEPRQKPSSYAMGIVRAVTINDLGETTGATVFKGSSRETVHRHATSLIPLLTGNTIEYMKPDYPGAVCSIPISRPKRLAAQQSLNKIKSLTNAELV